MSSSLTRRALIGTGLGAGALGLAGCTAKAAAPASNTEEAFPPEKFGVEDELLGPESGVAQLSRNENPYGPSESARRMIDFAARKGAYYPSRRSMMRLKEMIAERHGLTPQQVNISTGSGEALCAIAMVYGAQGRIVAPRLFWDTTALYAKRLGMAEIDRVDLKPSFEVDLEAVEKRVDDGVGLVQLCNPNNPTGLVTPASVIKPAVKRMAKTTTVLVDEAYMELADAPDDTSCIDLVRAGHNVIVTRTFSKIYGMAGVRVGYTISSEEVAEKISETTMTWSPSLSFAAAIGCYNDEPFLEYSKRKVIEGREMVMETLAGLGMQALPSQTNFVYFKSGKAANDVQAALKARQIMVRPQYMDYAEWTRVSMGTLEDIERFCKALPEVIA